MLVLTRLLKHLVTAWLFTIICVVWVGSVVVLEVFDAETVRTSSFSDGCLSFWVVSLAFGSVFFCGAEFESSRLIKVLMDSLNGSVTVPLNSF